MTAVPLKAGARLVRDWGERRHVVLVRADGYVFEDRHYTSLSQIASDITGAHWSGPRFFGLKTRGRSFEGATSGKVKLKPSFASVTARAADHANA